MDAPRTILAGVDGGPGTALVVQSAARLAAAAGSGLVVAHILPRPLPVLPEVAALSLEFTEEDALADVLPEIWIALADTTVPWKVLSGTGVPAAELVRIARDLQPTAVVVGADTAGWLARLRRGLNGSVPARLARDQDAPVIVIPAACSHRRKVRHGAARMSPAS